MATPTPTEPETVHRRIREYLDRVGRVGDRERIAQRVAVLDCDDATVVGFRRRGRELVVYVPGGDGLPAELVIYAVGRGGRLDRIGRLWRGRELDRWLSAHRYYLEWIRPGLGEDETSACVDDGRVPGIAGVCGEARGRRVHRPAAPCKRPTRPISEP